MKTRLHIALALAVCSSAALAETPRTTSITLDCAHLARPTQREVGELLGMNNLGQVYAARTELMANARRDCKRGADRVVLVVNPGQHPRSEQLARQTPRR